LEQSLFNASIYIKHRLKLVNPDSYQFPKLCVLGFFPTLYRYISQHFDIQKVDFINTRHPYFILKKGELQIAFLCPGVGAPLAGAQLDETIAMGAEKILFFGSCGVIDPHVRMDSIILLNGAVSDEGTSRHYKAESNSIQPDCSLFDSLQRTFIAKGIPCFPGKTWTTDAVYRETPSKIKDMRQKGCVCVDMESSALFSIARFYQKKIAGFLVPGDRLTEHTWQPYIRNDNHLHLKPSNLLELVFDSLIDNELK